jgi:hypothetical protein
MSIIRLNKNIHHRSLVSLNIVWSIEYLRSNQTKHGVSEIFDTEMLLQQAQKHQDVEIPDKQNHTSPQCFFVEYSLQV